MRQRILIAIALLLTLYLVGTLLIRGGKPPARLTMVAFPSLAWTYELEIETQTLRENVEPQFRRILSDFTVKARTTRGTRGFENSLSFGQTQVFVDGIGQKMAAAPRVYLDASRDLRARPVIEGFADLYPLEALSSPLFFPFLSGRRSGVGDSWMDQFRIVLPWEREQMIVVLTTRLTDVRSSREAVLTYQMKGEALYQVDRDQDAKTPPTKEKALLTLVGECTFDPVTALPLQQHQEMVLEAFDFDLLRNTAPPLSPTFARQVRIRTEMDLRVVDKGDIFAPRDTRTATPTPVPVDELEFE